MASRYYMFWLLLLPLGVLAQAELPSMDVQIKTGIQSSEITAYKYNGEYITYECFNTSLQVELNWNLAYYFSIGAYYTRSLGNYPITVTDHAWGVVPFDGKSSTLNYGLKARAALGRKPRYRPFAEVAFGKFEMYIEQNGYRLANSTTALGLSAGLMTKLGSQFYIVFPQATVRLRSDPFYFESGTGPIYELSMGLSYNIGKKL